METLIQDLRYGCRTLIKRPGFTAIALVTLALGIGANSAIFTVVDAALLRVLPYKEPDRLMHLWETRQATQFSQREFSYPDYLDLKQQANSFENIAGYQRGQAYTLTGRDTPEEIPGAAVTANFFSTVGVSAARGRTFQPKEDQPGASRTVMLSHGIWQRRFAADPNIAGQTIRLGDVPFTVIGVLPAGFKFAPVGDAALWITILPNQARASARHWHWINLISRLKSGVSKQEAQLEMDTFAQRLAVDHPDSHKNTGVRLVSLRDEILGTAKPLLLVLLGAVSFVLLIACANVANLFLSRSVSRRKEIAVRMALGAGRWRLIRQLLTEAVLLSIMGGALGLLLAVWGVRMLVAAIPQSQIEFMPYLQGLTIDLRILLFTSVLSVLTGILFGIAPALQGSRTDLHGVLKEGERTTAGSMRHSVRNSLVITEIALALVLLVGGGLMMTSFLRLLQVDPGFKTDHLLTFDLQLSSKKYSNPEQVVNFYQQLRERIRSLPGVKGADVTSKLPLRGGDTTNVYVAGQPKPVPGNETEVNFRDIGSDYLQVMDAKLNKGRYFTDQDKIGAPRVVIINQTLANRLFPGQSAVGQRLVGQVGDGKESEIVGVVADMKEAALDRPSTPVVYEPYLMGLPGYLSVSVRSDVDPWSLISAARREVLAIDPDLPIADAASMDQLIANAPSTFLRRYPALLIGIFAFVALVLAIVGIYGVISYSVSQRTHELAIRMALGARQRAILKLVIGKGLILAIVGIVTGLLISFMLTRFLASLLFGVSPTDPLTFGGISLLLIVVATIACYLPAHRATKVDPMVTLRYE